MGNTFTLLIALHSGQTLRDAQNLCMRINSRRMSRVFCDLRSQKTPRGIFSAEREIFWQFYEIRLTFRQYGDKLKLEKISFIKLIQWMQEIWLLTEKCGLPQGNQICRMPTVWATFVELQVLPFFYLSGKRSGHRKRRCVCKKEIMGKCQRDYEKTVMVCGWTVTDNEMWWQGGKSYVSWRVYGIM